MSDTNREEGSELAIDFSKRGGLVTAVAQEAESGEVLMVASVNEAALAETIASGYATFWSTSRNTLWKKGETSGDYLKIEEIRVDCDQDALLYRVTPQGAGACHTVDPATGKGRKSCFYRVIGADGKSLDLVG